MKKGVTFAALAILALALLPPGASAGKRHHKHKPAGVKGVVLDTTCPGACAVEPPPSPRYTGALTITVTRASDGAQVVSREITDGHFRFRLKRGSYDVSAVPPNPPACEPTPTTVCPMPTSQGAPIIAPCLTGETKPVQVRRDHFTRVSLHVRNVCIV